MAPGWPQLPAQEGLPCVACIGSLLYLWLPPAGRQPCSLSPTNRCKIQCCLAVCTEGSHLKYPSVNDINNAFYLPLPSPSHSSPPLSTLRNRAKEFRNSVTSSPPTSQHTNVAFRVYACVDRGAPLKEGDVSQSIRSQDTVVMHPRNSPKEYWDRTVHQGSTAPQRAHCLQSAIQTHYSPSVPTLQFAHALLMVKRDRRYALLHTM